VNLAVGRIRRPARTLGLELVVSGGTISAILATPGRHLRPDSRILYGEKISDDAARLFLAAPVLAPVLTNAS